MTNRERLQAIWDKRVGSSSSSYEATGLVMDTALLDMLLSLADAVDGMQADTENGKVIADMLHHGTGFMKDGKRIDPKDVYKPTVTDAMIEAGLLAADENKIMLVGESQSARRAITAIFLAMQEARK